MSVSGRNSYSPSVGPLSTPASPVGERGGGALGGTSADALARTFGAESDRRKGDSIAVPTLDVSGLLHCEVTARRWVITRGTPWDALILIGNDRATAVEVASVAIAIENEQRKVLVSYERTYTNGHVPCPKIEPGGEHGEPVSLIPCPGSPFGPELRLTVFATVRFTDNTMITSPVAHLVAKGLS